MLIENHQRIIKECTEAIQWAIDKGIEDRQTTIGFNCSLIGVNLLEVYLHKNNLLKVDNLLKHEWFASKNKVKDKIDFEFNRKKEILELMHDIEERRNILCYGKKQKLEEINQILEKMYALKKIFKEMGVDDESY